MTGNALTFRGMLDFWPNRKKAAAALQLPYQTVASWYERGNVPINRWKALVVAAQRAGYREVTIAACREARIGWELATSRRRPGKKAVRTVSLADGGEA